MREGEADDDVAAPARIDELQSERLRGRGGRARVNDAGGRKGEDGGGGREEEETWYFFLFSSVPPSWRNCEKGLPFACSFFISSSILR